MRSYQKQLVSKSSFYTFLKKAPFAAVNYPHFEVSATQFCETIARRTCFYNPSLKRRKKTPFPTNILPRAGKYLQRGKTRSHAPSNEAVSHPFSNCRPLDEVRLNQRRDTRGMSYPTNPGVKAGALMMKDCFSELFFFWCHVHTCAPRTGANC